MRYQERIYPQTNVSALRNRDINIFNMSTDICVFNTPTYYVSGATILDCSVLSATSVSGYSHMITGETQSIDLTFVFTSNTETFSGNNSSFKYNLYIYQDKTSTFLAIPSYTSNEIYYSSLTENISVQEIPSSALTLDNEYMVKGFSRFPICTEYMSRLNKSVDTSRYVSGNEYGIYDKRFDYYLAVVQKAATPEFNYNASNSAGSSTLLQSYLPVNYYTIYPDINQLQTDANLDEFDEDLLAVERDYTIIGIPVNIDTPFILTLNGLVLARDADYTYSGGSIVYLKAPLVPEDIVTIIYTATSPNPLKNDIFDVSTPIPSGSTNGEGYNSVYYNTTTNRYELFTSIKPIDFNTVLVMINGVVLSNGVDFYQSTSNPKRIILNGDLMLNDIITISYFPDGVAGDINTQTPSASWSITPTPNKVNGYFTLELSTDVTFSNIVYTATTDYLVGATYYNLEFPVSGYTYGDRLFYRVKNDKNYETICGNIISSYAYSESIPITIATNSINSY